MSEFEWTFGETLKALHGTYVISLPAGQTGLACGGCGWEHAFPGPFLMGDGARLAIVHKRTCLSLKGSEHEQLDTPNG